MEDYKPILKQKIENSIFTSFQKQVEVKFVDDVALETRILTEGLNIYQFIPNKHNTGMFIPWAGRDKAYILIQTPQDDCLDIKTAFHEFQHCIDYCSLLSYFKSEEDMAKSKVYTTFNIYSEFLAILHGYLNYFKFVKHDTEDYYDKALFTATDQFLNQTDITNKFQYLNHVLVYYAKCIAIDKFLNESKSIIKFFKNINSNEDIFDVLDCINHYEKSFEWYVDFDRVCREYIG